MYYLYVWKMLENTGKIREFHERQNVQTLIFQHPELCAYTHTRMGLKHNMSSMTKQNSCKIQLKNIHNLAS